MSEYCRVSMLAELHSVICEFNLLENGDYWGTFSLIQKNLFVHFPVFYSKTSSN